MSVDLPTAVADYYAADNGDADAIGPSFHPDAIVSDEEHTYEGLSAIQSWWADTKRKYHHTIEALRSEQRDGKTVVATRVTGNFPGSPIELDYVFDVKDGKIASLEIQ